ncbi:MAG: hypothetical protein KGJ13_08795, partial [Patescibacteria group bacterium]|nr:hypothetical protein [Patescibacteria group bacterium]
ISVAGSASALALSRGRTWFLATRRHSSCPTLAANLLAENNGGKRFTWGSVNLVDESPEREKYIKALKHADKTEDVSSLLKYAKL